MALKGVYPILNTSDLPSLLAFLTEKVGFVQLWDVKANDGTAIVYAGLSYEGSELHAQPADATPKGMQVYIEVDAADEIYGVLKDKGANPTEPENQFYGMRDFSVTGPEGTLIGFGSQIPNS